MSSSISGMTSTDANEVCRRLAWSNGEIRTSRCVPASADTSPYARWGYRQTAPNAKRVGTVTVDTDWDGTPDTLLPGTSNFYPGRGARFGGKIIAQDHASLHQVEN